MAMHSYNDQLTDPGDTIEKTAAVGITNKTPDNGQGFVKTKDAQILVNDGTTNRIAIGQRGDGTYGIKVARVGADVLTGTNAQMVMNSDFNMFKIVASGTLSINIPAAAGTFQAQIAHNLGYSPAFMGFVTELAGVIPGGSYLQLPFTSLVVASSPMQIAAYSEVAVDGTYVYSTLQTDSGVYAGRYTIKYYLFQETAS